MVVAWFYSNVWIIDGCLLECSVFNKFKDTVDLCK